MLFFVWQIKDKQILKVVFGFWINHNYCYIINIISSSSNISSSSSSSAAVVVVRWYQAAKNFKITGSPEGNIW